MKTAKASKQSPDAVAEPVIPAPEPKAKKQAPEPPEQDPAFGDKTPAYVAWFKENHSESEFEAKYGNRKISQE